MLIGSLLMIGLLVAAAILAKKNHPLTEKNKRLADLHFTNGLELILSYTNSDDESEERKITAYALGKFNNAHYIIAHCHLRDAQRTFKLSRIRRCIDCSTGEIITKVKAHILAFNPLVLDLRYEFESVQREREANERSNNF